MRFASRNREATPKSSGAVEYADRFRRRHPLRFLRALGPLRIRQRAGALPPPSPRWVNTAASWERFCTAGRRCALGLG
jgi:hypothetical protein